MYSLQSHYNLVRYFIAYFSESEVYIGLEHILFKNGSKESLFSWQKQIQMIEYGLNDAIRIKKKQVILIIYSFTPSDMNMNMKGYWQKFCHKNIPCNILMLSML